MAHDIKFDHLGPSKVITLYFPKTGFEAIVVIDNTALGPAIGGVRVSPSVSAEEVMRLARTMTLKNSIAGIPHGGGKAGIVADPKHPDKERYFRLFAKEISSLTEYIPGPDMGSNEESMAWIYDEIGRAVGLPEDIGGLPLDKLGATGFGLSECAEVACPYAGIGLKGAKIAIQGFGSVGRAAAKFLSKKGALIVAVSDTKGTAYNADGLDMERVQETKSSSGSVINTGNAEVKAPEDIFSLPCDILIPAATPDVITEKNVHNIKARLILQGANIPATGAAEEMLHKKGILSIPDFIANAGGVIMAAMEYAGRTEKGAFEAIALRIKKNTEQILGRSVKENILPRTAAEGIAEKRVLRAMKYRGRI